MAAKFLQNSLQAAFVGVVGASGVLGLLYRNDLNQLEFDLLSATGPILRLIDAEQSHRVGIEAAKWGIWPRERRPDPESLRVRVWGKTFQNPVGLAAGFDKDGEVIDAMLGGGFGFIEVGSVTPLPQPGNPRPRLFRLQPHRATINRYGFNSAGVDAVSAHLFAWRSAQQEQHAREANDVAQRRQIAPKFNKWHGIVGVNLGKNKLTQDAAQDYVVGFRRLGIYADYIVINVSSPNTPGLRAWQGYRQLASVVKRVQQERGHVKWEGLPPPILLKIAPDLSQSEMVDIANVALRFRVEGLIVSNTTVERPAYIQNDPNSKEDGGLSGPPLMERSTYVLRQMYQLTKGRIPIIGCGGVSSAEDAYTKIRAGASLVQLYTAMAYEGPRIVPLIKQGLAELLAKDGFENVQQAVGADVKS